MKNCPNCSLIFDDSAMHCSNCGAALEVQVAEPVQQPVPQPAPVQYNNNPYGAPNVKYCPRCGNQCDPLAVICVRCGLPFNMQSTEPDVPSTGLKVLSLFIPLVALILYLTNNDKKPISAKAYGKMGLIGLGINFAFTVVFYIFYFALIGLSYSSPDYYYSIFSGLFF